MNLQRRRRSAARRSVGALASILATGCSGADDASVTVTTVPTAPAYVSGGDALLRIELGSGLTFDRVTVSGGRANVVNRAPADRLGREENAALALVTGLDHGDNEIVVRVDGEPATSLTVTNYPVSGPIFSGEHLEPYFCLDELTPGNDGQARRFAVGNGDVLDGRDFADDCAMETRVDFVYRTAGEEGAFAPLADPATLPADAAQATTSEGKTVPFVVRLETGTINRAIYQTAILVDPAAPQPSPWQPSSSWNGRLVYTFGGGCEAGFFQGPGTGGVLRANLLGAGYAVASSSLNVNAQGGCNDPLSAETAMMVKERFAEAYGPPLHTIGNGGSGGAMQQLLIAGAYPGILDGIMPTLTFPDAISYFIDTAECRLPLRRFLNGRDLEEETKRVVGGWARWFTCEQSLGPRPNRIGPDDCPAAIPKHAAYDPDKNPTGVRCSIFDAMRSVFGTARYDDISPAPEVEFARSPHDNVGVQYGLAALNEGLIDKRLFLDMNAQVGGWDIDFQWRPERAKAAPEVVGIAYETGRITSGGGGLAVTPIIDERAYLDLSGNFHTSYYSFVMRERLRRDNGHSDNYVLQRRGQAPSLAMENLVLMDRWLDNLALDTSGATRAEKVVRAKPPELVDACYEEDGTRIAEPQEYDAGRLYHNTEGRCNTLFQPHTGARMVAGAPLTSDVLKCQLKPLDRSDYEVQFTEAEWAELGVIFPDGVCDWSKPGVGQTTNRTWLSFGPSPVNRYRPPA